MKNHIVKTAFAGIANLAVCICTYGQSLVSITPASIQTNVPCTLSYGGNAGTVTWYLAEQGILNYPAVSYGFLSTGNSIVHSFNAPGVYFLLTVAGTDTVTSRVLVNDPPRGA
jgi:hypothetical protein